MSIEISNDFLENVDRCLEALGKNRDWLAAGLNIHPSGVRKVFSEKRAIKIDTLVKWATVLKTTPNALLGYDDSRLTRDPTRQEIALAAIRGFDLSPDQKEIMEAVLTLEPTLLSGLLALSRSLRNNLPANNKFEASR